MGVKTAEDYEAAKQKAWEEQQAREDVDLEEVAFLEAPAPAPLEPIVVQLQEFTEEMARAAETMANVQPQPYRAPQPQPYRTPQPQDVVVRVQQESSSGFGGGGVVGLLFTLWLVYNMS